MRELGISWAPSPGEIMIQPNDFIKTEKSRIRINDIQAIKTNTEKSVVVIVMKHIDEPIRLEEDDADSFIKAFDSIVNIYGPY